MSSFHKQTEAKNFRTRCDLKFCHEYRPSHCPSFSVVWRFNTVNAHRSLLQSHSAGQSSFPQTSCVKPRSCLLSDLNKVDGRKSSLTHAAMRSLRVEVSSPRAASAPFLSCNAVSIQRQMTQSTYFSQHIFTVFGIKACKLMMQPRQSRCERKVATLQPILSGW